MNKDFKSEIIYRRLEQPLVLIGLMGSGKTSVGKLLAKELGLGFYDSDEEIEKAAGCTVSEIFERFGEPHFRDGERKVIARLMEGGPCIIATGGGAVMTPQTAELIWAQSLSLWLKADIDVLVKRTSRNNDRPLLKEKDPHEVFGQMIKDRYPVYEKAILTVEGYDDSPKETLHRVLETLYGYLNDDNG